MLERQAAGPQQELNWLQIHSYLPAGLSALLRWVHCRFPSAFSWQTNHHSACCWYWLRCKNHGCSADSKHQPLRSLLMMHADSRALCAAQGRHARAQRQ